MTPPATAPADRYGRSAMPGRRRGVVAMAAALVLAGVGLAVWAGVAEARRPVRWELVGFSVRGASAVEARFRVTQREGHRAVCTLRALSEGRAVVGLVDVPVGPARTDTTLVTTTVPTSETATTVVVQACVAA